MISGSNEQLQQLLEYTLLKPDCHSWWISKLQSDTLEEQYAIKLTRKGLEFHECTINKSASTKKSLETYRMHLVSIFFLSFVFLKTIIYKIYNI